MRSLHVRCFVVLRFHRACNAERVHCAVAVLDLSNWRGSAPVFCAAPKGQNSKLSWVGFETWGTGGLTLTWEGG